MIDEPIAYVLFILIAIIIIAGVIAYQNTIGQQLQAIARSGQDAAQINNPLLFQPKGKAKSTVTYPNRIGWPKEISRVDMVNHSGALDPKFKMYTVTGTVRNTGNMLARDTRVTATFYGAGGKTLAQVGVFTGPKDIEAGKTAGFKIICFDRKVSAKVTSYKTQVVWTQIYQHP